MFEEMLKDVSAFGGLPLYVAVTALVYFIDIGLAMRLGLGLVAAYFVTIIIRALYFKERPKPRKYKNIIEKIDASSFPSLHTIRVTVLVVILGNSLVHPVQQLVLGLSWLGVCGMRIKLDKHHASDVLGGAFLGLLVASSVIWA